MTEYMPDMGNIIRDRRLERHLTQEELAEKAGISPSFVGQIERNEEYPSLGVLARLIRVLKIDSNVFFYFSLQEKGSGEVESGVRFEGLRKDHQELVMALLEKLEELQKGEKTGDDG